jgi:hypothetical protein
MSFVAAGGLQLSWVRSPGLGRFRFTAQHAIRRRETEKRREDYLGSRLRLALSDSVLYDDEAMKSERGSYFKFDG